LGEDSAPGKLSTPQDIDAHAQRMRKAIDDMVSGRPVDVEGLPPVTFADDAARTKFQRDMADHLQTEEDVANYLTLVLADNDPAELRHALGTIARAKGMSEVALASGLTREALYKALRRTSQPRFDTITKVCAALGVKLVAVPLQSSTR
jgi:probable addiction module antidote protein